jgi:hypothetical protein
MSDPYRRDNVAPDSRLTTVVTPRGAVQREFLGRKLWMVPTYCINCGANGPWTPQENMRAFSYLCTPCFERHGTALAGTVLPDQVFWEMVRLECLEAFGRELTHNELAAVEAADASPLARLLKLGR